MGGNANTVLTGCLATTRLAPNGIAVAADARRVFGSRHSGGAFFALCDGSIRFIYDTVDSANPDSVPYRPGTYQALSTRAGGEVALVD